MSRSGGNVADGIRHASGVDINGDVAARGSGGSDDEGIDSAADDGEGSRGAVADVDLADIEAVDGFGEGESKGDGAVDDVDGIGIAVADRDRWRYIVGNSELVGCRFAEACSCNIQEVN